MNHDRLNTSLLVAAALFALAQASPAFAQAGTDAIFEAGIDHGALVVRTGDQPPRMVQGGGGARALPVWSPDGGRIAFVQAIDRRLGLADLVVVSSAGVELARVTIEPVTADTAYAGMRFVEAVRWLSNDRIVVRGSLNPSQSQYYVVDAGAARITDDFVDDRSAAAFSPDGRHVASQTGSPHFVSAQQHAPQMAVDGKTIYPAAGRTAADFASEPRWSADSGSLAWLVQRSAPAATALVIWNAGALSETAVPLGAGKPYALFWSGKRVVVTTRGAGAGQARAWSIDANGGGAKTLAASAAVDPQAAALALRERLAAAARAAGLAQPDVWCRACGLESLPRSSE